MACNKTNLLPIQLIYDAVYICLLRNRYISYLIILLKDIKADIFGNNSNISTIHATKIK
jgi:hypothetical protein